jgi:hypothetical protein
METQRVQQLETLLAEYKATIDNLTRTVNALGGGDPPLVAHWAEAAKVVKAEFGTGDVISTDYNFVLPVKQNPFQRLIRSQP